jgi:filamin
LSVIWGEKEIHGSPFKINVLSNIKTNHSASRVICSGDGLRIGILGKEMRCFIDTREASPGELIAYCQGINKTAFCRLLDHRDGIFTLFIKPEESGKHLLTVKYNGENVPGSPYTVRVSDPPDAREYWRFERMKRWLIDYLDKVRVSGPGIEHGVLSTFQSHFICETKGAGKIFKKVYKFFNIKYKIGAGQLTVKIRGPKGAFHVEMQREHPQDRTIICRYNPTEPGDYIISVKWGGEHVYGSPFHTCIFASQDELDQFRHQINNYRLVEQ